MLLYLSEIKSLTCIQYKHAANAIISAFIYPELYQTK